MLYLATLLKSSTVITRLAQSHPHNQEIYMIAEAALRTRQIIIQTFRPRSSICIRTSSLTIPSESINYHCGLVPHERPRYINSIADLTKALTRHIRHYSKLTRTAYCKFSDT